MLNMNSLFYGVNCQICKHFSELSESLVLIHSHLLEELPSFSSMAERTLEKKIHKIYLYIDGDIKANVAVF